MKKTGSRHVKDAVLWLLRWGIESMYGIDSKGENLWEILRDFFWWLGNPNDMILFGFFWNIPTSTVDLVDLHGKKYTIH